VGATTPAEDDAAVRNVIALLAQRADGGDVDAYVDLFTPDASWEMPGAPRKGHADIRSGSLARRSAGETGPGTHTRHVVTTTAVTVNRDSAEADSYWLFLVDTSREPRVRLMGTYHDTFERTAAGWKLARRQISFG
jgi:ketosteroid isomerase-like protein